MARRKLSRKLEEVLGPEAATDMSEWMDHIDDRNDELQQEVRGDIAELRHDLSTFKDEMYEFKEEMREFKSEMRVGIAELRQEMRVGFARIDTRFEQVDTRFAQADATFARELSMRNTNFMKWAIGFWIASLRAIAGTVVTVGRLAR